MTGITVPGEIRDELLRRIDLFADVVRVMELPEVLEPWGALDNLKRPGHATLGRVVVHDGDSWPHAMYERLCSRPLGPVTAGAINRDVSQQVGRAHQLHFLIPGQICQVEIPK